MVIGIVPGFIVFFMVLIIISISKMHFNLFIFVETLQQ